MTDIKFPHAFEHDRDLPIPLGRIHIGDHIGRLSFCPDGKLRLFISKTALEDGSVVVYEPLIGEMLVGFGPHLRKEDAHDG